MKKENRMSKFVMIGSLSLFLVMSGFSVWAEMSGTGSSGMESQDTMKQKKNRGSSIDTQSPTNKSNVPDQQKGARPGEAGEEGETSIFGSPSTLPPSENSPGYTGADKEQEQREQQQQAR
jgi:hypothetical protein